MCTAIALSNMKPVPIYTKISHPSCFLLIPPNNQAHSNIATNFALSTYHTHQTHNHTHLASLHQTSAIFALCHIAPFSSSAILIVEVCLSMKISVKPLDLAYHTVDPSHPLSLFKGDSLADRTRFQKYSKEEFLKDIKIHSNLKPASQFDTFCLTPAPPSPNLEPLTPAQSAYWLHKEVEEDEDLLPYYRLEFETENDTQCWIFSGDFCEDKSAFEHSEKIPPVNSSPTDNTDSSSGKYLYFINIFRIFEFV